MGKGGTDVIDRSRFERNPCIFIPRKNNSNRWAERCAAIFVPATKKHTVLSSLLFVPPQKVKKRLKVTRRLSVRLDPPSKHRSQRLPFSSLFPLPALNDRQSIRLTRRAMVMDGCQLIWRLIVCLLIATPPLVVSINWM